MNPQEHSGNTLSSTSKSNENIKPVATPAKSAAKWAFWLSSPLVLVPLLAYVLSSGTSVSPEYVGTKFAAAIVMFPVLFVVFWLYGVITKKEPITGIPSELTSNNSPPPTAPTPRNDNVTMGNAPAMPLPVKQVDAKPQSFTPVNLPSSPSAAPLPTTIDSATEDELYEKIGSELASGNTHTPTWLKAFAQANGDEKIAKANYIKFRLEKLLSDELEKIDGAADASLATKTCPKCAEVIKLEALMCRFCQHQYSEIALSSQITSIFRNRA